MVAYIATQCKIIAAYDAEMNGMDIPMKRVRIGDGTLINIQYAAHTTIATEVT